jgi:hypothetical protein
MISDYNPGCVCHGGPWTYLGKQKKIYIFKGKMKKIVYAVLKQVSLAIRINL